MRFLMRMSGRVRNIMMKYSRFIKEEEVKDYENENEQTRKILGTV